MPPRSPSRTNSGKTLSVSRSNSSGRLSHPSTPATPLAGASPGGTGMNVAYFTDVEGNWEYLASFVALSEALKRDGENEDGSMRLQLNDGWRIVFGGDSCDKGGVVGGSVRVVRTLVRLKKKYPDRVTLLLGNRDLNKMRITSELADEEELHGAHLDEIPGPYWVPEKNRVSPKKYLQLLASKEIPADATQPTDKQLWPTDDQLWKYNTPWNRLCWMLKDTMGSAGEEERRRKELELLNPQEGTPTEDRVVASFVESVQEGGFMREYIELGQLAEVIDGTLFVHGGIVGTGWAGGATDCLGFVPGQNQRIDDVQEWVKALNEWKDMQVDEWKNQPKWSVRPEKASYDAGKRGGNELMNYCVDGSPPSVVVGRHLDPKGMPRQLESALCSKLRACGVYRMVLGHTPHGNCPTMIRSGDESCPFLVAMVDTSYSDMKAPDNRGDAVSTLDVMKDGTIRVRGQLPQSVEGGARIEYEMPPDPNKLRCELVGTMQPANEPDGCTPTANRRFVKARLVQSGQYLLCHVDGYKVEYSTMSDAEARKLFKVQELSFRRKSTTAIMVQDDLYHRVSLEEKKHLIDQLFESVDSNGDGTIEATELKAALETNSSARGIFKALAGVGTDSNRLLECLERDGRKFDKEDVMNFFMIGVVEAMTPHPPTPRIRASRSGFWSVDQVPALTILAEEQPKANEETATLVPSAIPSEPLVLPSAAPASWWGGLLERFDLWVLKLTAWYLLRVRHKKLEQMIKEIKELQGEAPPPT